MGRKEELKVFESLKKLHGLMSSQRELAMEMFTHPEATANQVMSVQVSLARSTAEYRKLFDETKKKLWGHEQHTFDWGRYRL